MGWWAEALNPSSSEHAPRAPAIAIAMFRIVGRWGRKLEGRTEELEQRRKE